METLGGLPDAVAQGLHHKCLPSTDSMSCPPLGLELHDKEQSPVIMEPTVEPVHDRRASSTRLERMEGLSRDT